MMRLLWLLNCLMGCSGTTLTQPRFEFNPKTITPTDTLQVVLKQDTAGAKTKYWWSLNESPCPNLNGDDLDVTAVNQVETFCTGDEEPVVVGDTWSVVIQQQMDGLYSPPFENDIVVGAGPDADEDADEDGDGHFADVDCDDTDPDIYPGAAEVCDEVDNNCNDEVDEGFELTTWWPDTDGDGYGDSDPSTSISACSMPEGYVDNDDDCNDSFAVFNPDAEEICDELDNDCDSFIDDDDPSLNTLTGGFFYLDSDGDGYGDEDILVRTCTMPLGYVYVGDDSYDCDDSDGTIHPDATEVCDEEDNDCDSFIDDDDPGLDTYTATTFYADDDGDGYGDAEVFVSTCTMPLGYVYVGDDSYDCDDSDGTIHPDAAEICDEVDNDCDSLFDDADPSLSGPTFYADADGDGHGDAETTIRTCGPMPDGYVVSDDFDCDDTIAGSTYMSIDADCDGSLTAADCDDAEATIHPGATEIWYDGVDQDCGGETLPDGYGTDYDADGDGFRSEGYWFLFSIYEGTDCNDANPDIHPDATEIWYDGVDQDCDDAYDYDADADSLSFGIEGATDCDDTDDESTSVATDGDCDSVLTEDDCDDGDPESTTVATDGDCDSVLTDDDCDDTDDETPAAYDCPIYECFTELGSYRSQTYVDASMLRADWWVGDLPDLLHFSRREMLHDFEEESEDDVDVVTIAEAFEVPDATDFEQNFCAPTLTLEVDTDGDFKGAGTPFDLGFDVVSTRLSMPSPPSARISFKVDTAEGIFSDPDTYEELSGITAALYTSSSPSICCDVMDASCSDYDGTGTPATCLYLEFAIDDIERKLGDIITIPDGACHPECDECDGDVCP